MSASEAVSMMDTSEIPPTLGDDAFSMDPFNDVERLRTLLEERRHQKIEKRRFNKVLFCSLPDNRLENLNWCKCSSDGRQKNCCTGHWRPKAAFCCKEAAAATTRFGIAYFEKLGHQSCIIENEDFQRRAFDLDKISGWVEMLREHEGVPIPGMFENNELRFAAYHSVTIWLYGTLGTKLHVPLSSCIVNAIRKKFPCQVGATYKDYASAGEDTSDIENEDAE